VLLVKHAARDYWSLPGGGVGRNENTFGALNRELWEELRIPPAWMIDHEKLGTYFSQREGKTDTIDIFILECKDSKFIQGYELDDAQWFDIAELPSDTSPATRRRIDEYLSGERGIERVW
jgi:8-oxo-dGTP pyrophosphatase MutT (NUDIX family)